MIEKLLTQLDLSGRQKTIDEGLINEKNMSMLGRELGISRERVRQLAERLPVPPIPPDYVTVRRAAEISGLTKGIIYKAICDNRIPYIRYGARWFVNPRGFRRDCRFCGTELSPSGLAGRWYCDRCTELKVPSHFAQVKYHLSVLDKILEKYNKDID